MKTKTNHYTTLGVGVNATLDDIKATYRRLAKIYHPDMLRDQDEDDLLVFEEINEAYKILSDPEKRRQYDMELSKAPIVDLHQVTSDIVSDYFSQFSQTK
jgi:DnaJ-class molecular chaperone